MMASYWRDCRYCGQRIIMAEDDRGYWQPLEPEGSGRHECGSGIAVQFTPSDSTTPSWSINTLGHPLTYHTTCWWCGGGVFFHTNGNGDSVLFDELGWPWMVHACWEQYRTEQRSSIIELERLLGTAGYDGIFYNPVGERINLPAHKGPLTVLADGYVADNHALHREPEKLHISLGDKSESPAWVRFEVGVRDGRLFPFLVPYPLAKEVKNYTLVRVSGRWIKWEGTWFLVATRLVSVAYPSGAHTRRKAARVGRTLKCHYCNRQVSHRKRWGFDTSFHIECEACSSFRGKLSPRQFLRRCRVIAMRRLGAYRRPRKDK